MTRNSEDRVKRIEARDGDHERYARELNDRLQSPRLAAEEIDGEWWLVRKEATA